MYNITMSLAESKSGSTGHNRAHCIQGVETARTSAAATLALCFSILSTGILVYSDFCLQIPYVGQSFQN